ncbi:diaminopimelate decarboxylase [Streptosporangium album]|uniref:Diaminopimelate decarboxylase n=1 Tax=Streptosporangium album TaxID=47479 RepID=A0A7W7S6B4_9ACTN|nr:type III PLP-dependent enzyme [Streptosporangium album]MBB4944048.1 diaminopimelate decarboxylase [Streptosporangium album]
MIDYDGLAARFGTPLYVYDLDRVAAARRDLFDTLPEGFALFYAVKANPHPDVLRTMREDAGRRCRVEISSTGELAAALTAGFTGADCLYTGPGKTTGELHEAIGEGVRTFSAESLTDLRRIGAVAGTHGVVAECLLRINSATSSSSTSIRMTGTPSQFGFDSESLAEVMPELVSTPGTRIAGAHLFSLSNAKDEESLTAELQHTVTVAARLQQETGVPMDFLDIGGGFSAPYAVPGERPRYGKLRGELEAALDTHFPHWREGAPEVACESGRYLAGDCGMLLSEVVNIKESRGRKFVILDAGINTFGGMAGLGRLLPPAVRLVHPAGPAEEVASLVGPLCTPGDIIGREVKLPPLKIGDVVAIPNAGAYGVTSSLLMFLGRPAPVEVTVRGGEIVSVSRLGHERAYGSAAER